MILKAEGIVLKTFNFRETSCIVTFFTKEHGKIKGVLKGIRKDPKKFGSHVDKFSVNQLVYYTHRNNDLHLVSHCDLTSFFFLIRKNLRRTLAASYALELVDSIMPTEEKNIKVYQLLINFLTELEEIKDINRLVHIFQIKILSHSGFKPFLDSCVVCQKHIVPSMKFSMKLGGLLCPDCFANDRDARIISRGAIASLTHIESNDWKKALRLKLTQPVQKELKVVLNNFLVFHLEKHIKSEKYLSAR
ncbi:MAG: DNA repair protein RecO [Candidatus Aceula meridiana]|nr:DNA repair protein RecO [Candidatus Aceula meridiana]